MPTQVIPRPSTLYKNEPAQDIDSRLMAARFAVDADIEDEAVGYAATPGLGVTVRLLEIEYRQTYGIDPPQSVSLMATLRAEHLRNQCSKST